MSRVTLRELVTFRAQIGEAYSQDNYNPDTQKSRSHGSSEKAKKAYELDKIYLEIHCLVEIPAMAAFLFT